MVHGDVIFLQVGENARREAVRHHLPIVAARGAKVAQLDLRAQSAQHHRLHVRDGEAVRAQVAEHLKCAQTIREQGCGSPDLHSISLMDPDPNSECGSGSIRKKFTKKKTVKNPWELL